MKRAKQPILGRDILLKIGQTLRALVEQRVTKRNARLDLLAKIADAKQTIHDRRAKP